MPLLWLRWGVSNNRRLSISQSDLALITSYADFRRQWLGPDTHQLFFFGCGDLFVSGNWLAANSWASYFGCVEYSYIQINKFTSPAEGLPLPHPPQSCVVFALNQSGPIAFISVSNHDFFLSLSECRGGPAPPTTEWLTDCLWMHSLALQIASTWTCLHRSI